ncbi:MAG: TonB C-terminal domain-containing protein [Nitrospiraceae bacterium]
MILCRSDCSTSSTMLFGQALLSLLLASDLPAAESSSNSASARPAPPAKRWVQFALENMDQAGILPAGKPLELSVLVGGVSGTDDVVATFESPLFYPQIATLEPDSTPTVLRGSVTLEPQPVGRTSVQPKAVRVQVTFARSRNTKLEPMMTRVVYLTLGQPESEAESVAESPLVEEKIESREGPDETQPDVGPVMNALIAEEDLLPLPSPGEGKAYWQEVSRQISRSWGHRSRFSRKAPTTEAVLVRFRMYASGTAQLIQIERGSGVRDIDIAGIQTIVHTQPFPPFPAELGTEAVDVHVRMRTGGRTTVRQIQPPANQRTEAGSTSARQ